MRLELGQIAVFQEKTAPQGSRLAGWAAAGRYSGGVLPWFARIQ